MKRIVSVFAILALLVMIVLSAYFITGLLTENALKKNLNTLKQANILSVDLTEYRRGLIKSKAELTWRMQTPEKIIDQKGGASLVVPSKSYIFEMPFTIDHGPVIFDHGNIRFGLGMAHGELVVPEAYLKAFHTTLTTNSVKPKLELHAFITYLNKTQLEIGLPAFHLSSNNDKTQIEWLGMNSSFVFFAKRARMQGEIKVEGLHLIGEKLQLMLEKVSSSYDLARAKNGLYLGEASFHLPMFQLMDKPSSGLKLKQLDVSSKSEVNQDLFASQLHLTFESLIHHEKTYGPAELDMSTKNLDAEVLADFNNRANQLQQGGMNRAQAQQALLSFLPDVPKLLSKGAIFEISQFKIGLPEGLMDASLRIAFPEAKKDAPPQLLPNVEGAGRFEIPATFVKSLLVRSYKQKLLMTSAHTETLAQEEPVEAQVTTANLDQQAIDQAEHKLTDLMQAGALQAKESDYVLDLKLSAGRLLVNGHPFHSGMLNF